MRWLLLSLVAVLIGTSLPTGAHAQADASAGSAKERAQVHFERGNEQMTAGNYGAAIEALEKAYGIYGDGAGILVNLGTAYRHAGRNAEAGDTYEAYLRHPRAKPEMRGEVEELIADIDRQVGHVSVRVSQPGAAVRLDGRALAGASGSSHRVEPGEHTVSARKEGFQNDVRSFVIAAGEQKTVELVLAPPADPELIDDGSTQRIIGYALGGVGIAGLVVGGVFGGLFFSAKSDADDHCDETVCDPEGGEATDEANRYGLISIISLGVGGAAVIAGVVVLFTAPGDEELAVGVGPIEDGWGATLHARW